MAVLEAEEENEKLGFHKVKKGSSGVELRYYKRQAFLDLPQE